MIATRYFPDLKSRPGSVLLNLWYGILALHKEAVSAYIARGRAIWVLMTIVQLPYRLAAMTFACLAAHPLPRGRFLGPVAAEIDPELDRVT